MLGQNEINYWLTCEALESLIHKKEFAKTELLIENINSVLNNDKSLILCPYYDKKRTKEMLSEKRALFPNRENNSPWTSAKLCYSGTLLNLFASDAQIFAVTPVKKSPNIWCLQLIRASLASPDNFTTISKAEGDYYGPADKGEIEFGDAYARSCISPKYIFAGTNGKGLIVFPLNGENPYKIGVENSLPSEYIQSCAWHDGKLYIALGARRKESFIVTYDIASASINTLASSQRNEKTSPFDNIGYPYYTRFIVPDAKNDRIIFLIDFDGIYPLPSELSDMQGVWAFNLKSSQWQQIVKIPHSRMQARLNGNYLLIFSSNSFCASLNIETDENALLLTGEYARYLKRSLNSEKSHDVNNLPAGAFTLINNEFSQRFSRIARLTDME
jgi:hypothetical protein